MKGVKPLEKDENILLEINLFQEKDHKIKNWWRKCNSESAVKTKKKHSKFDLLFGDINKDLKRGKIKIDRRLDLHGYSLDEAYLRFKEVIKPTIKTKRCLLIIV